METKSLLKYVHIDGTIAQHVSVTEFVGQYATRYTVSWSNSLSNMAYTSQPYGDKDAALLVAQRLRSSFIADLLSALSEL